MVVIKDLEVLEEIGICSYRHPLIDAVAHQGGWSRVQDRIEAVVRKDGSAIRRAAEWTVSGLKIQGWVKVGDILTLPLHRRHDRS